MKNLIFGIALATALSHSSIQAQNQPVIHTFTLEDGASISGLSPNGLWGTAKGKNTENETLDAYPYLLNVKEGKAISLLPEGEKPDAMYGAYDVTDDGKTVVGTMNDQPAIYKEGEGWKIMPGAEKIFGAAQYITGNGKYIIGINMRGMQESPLLWENEKLVTVTGLPTKDAGGYTAEQNRFVGVSEDGNILLGCLSYSHPGWGCCYYIYKRDTKQYKMLGWEEIAKPGHVDQAALSPNGKWVTGTAHISTPIPGESFNTEYDIPYRYDVDKNKFILYNEVDDQDIGGFAINNDGTVFGAAPFGTPARTLQYRYGNFWYELQLVLKGRYTMDYMEETNYDYTGTPVSISSDGKTIAAVAMSNTFNYIVTLPESFEEAAKNVNLLADPIVYPGNGYKFSKVKNITVTFTKNAQVKEGAKAALYEGQTLLRESMPIQKTTTSEKAFAVTFRTTLLEDGKTYTLKIPAGTFTLPGTDLVSEEITATYTGRKDIPVYTTKISPADGSIVSEISYDSPVAFAFDVPLTVVAGASGKLYQEGNDTPLCDLTITNNSNLVAVYPALKRYLFKDINYTVVIPDSCVTDIMGNCPNEEITLHYKGIYERPVQEIDNDIFRDDFDDPSSSQTRFLLWDGDKNTPTDAAKAFGFDNQNNPWNFTIRETDTGTDYCAGSHSMYTPAGTSNDWMSTIQLNLPNEHYFLYFNSQSYKKDKEDRLKVFVWENDAVINNLNDELIAQFEKEGKCIYNEVEYPGANEESLSGEWKHNKLSLAEFKGKNVYIGFVNQNNDQSMLFLDSIHVTYEGPFALGSNTETVVTQQDEVEISGYIKVTGDKTYSGLKAYYKNADKEIQEEKTFDGLNLKKGDIYKFNFDKKMPVETGKINNFSIGVEIEGGVQEIKLNVKNLAFTTTKRVVVEEGTGAWCQNCPKGILALEHLEKLLPNNVIAVGIHNRDEYDFPAYYNYLKITGFPSGVVNRIDSIYSPMYQSQDESGNPLFSFVSPSRNETFTDIVLRELDTDAEADIQFGDVVYDTDIKRIALPTTVNYAVDINSANYNVFYVLLEDGLKEIQFNNLYTTKDPILGEWGKGGMYGIPSTEYYYKDVARAVIGSFNGIAGYIPNTVEANKPISFEVQQTLPEGIEMDNASAVCMLINANTGRIVNAVRSRFVKGVVDPNNETINGIEANKTEEHNAIIRTEGQNVIASFKTTGKAIVTLYDINGSVINQAQGNVTEGETIRLSANGHSGIIIVRAVADKQVTVQKLIIR